MMVEMQDRDDVLEMVEPAVQLVTADMARYPANGMSNQSPLKEGGYRYCLVRSLC